MSKIVIRFLQRKGELLKNLPFFQCVASQLSCSNPNSIRKAKVSVPSKPSFFQAAFLQLLKLLHTCMDHCFTSVSSAGQMKVISFKTEI